MFIFKKLSIMFMFSDTNSKTKMQELLFCKKNLWYVLELLDHIHKDRTSEKESLRKSKNLESLFTVLIPEIKSTIRSSSCKSVMYLNTKTSIRSCIKSTHNLPTEIWVILILYNILPDGNLRSWPSISHYFLYGI
jgi:CRISPR/Cas system-associated exonuclease Cas4 (RecB family)